MKRFVAVVLAILLGFFAQTGVRADEKGFTSSIISEVRGGISAHDMYLYWLPYDLSLYHFDQIEDVTFEILFRLPDVDAFRWIGSPKINVGGTLNMDGQESIAHLALTWQVPVFETGAFVEASIGGAIHNGVLNGPWRGSGFLRPQGCRVEFYTSAGVGYNFTESVYAMLSYEHISHAGLCGRNNYGVSNMGVKLGFRLP